MKEPRNNDPTSKPTTALAGKLTCVAVAGLALLMLHGCSVLVGNIKPISEKSGGFSVMELDKTDSQWKKLDTQAEYQQALENETADSPPSSELDASDIAYQHQKTAAIISLNSGCRPRNALEENTLSQFTDALLLGITDVSNRTEKKLTLQDQPALETTLNGSMGNQAVKLSVVVLKQKTCVFDLMLVARAKYFEDEKKIFDLFVNSFKFQN